MKSAVFGAVAATVIAAALSAQVNAGSTSHSTDNQSTMATATKSDHGAKKRAATSAEQSGEPASADHGTGAVHWGYAGEAGPAFWGDLARDYHACKAGQSQSPIDLSGGVAAASSPILFDYHVTALETLHNGHTVQINYAPGSGILLDGKRFELLQFHFHAPSEHLVNGAPAVLEGHLVHKSADGQLAVVGVLFKNGEENLALREIWQSMPQQAGPAQKNQRVVINARDLLPSGATYFRYMGSLTTPPCSEGVNWLVMAEPVTVSAEQVQRFVQAAGPNARPVQALNSRLLLSPTQSN